MAGAVRARKLIQALNCVVLLIEILLELKEGDQWVSMLEELEDELTDLYQELR